MNRKWQAALFVLLITAGFSCTKKSNGSPSLSSILSQGTWNVHHFHDHGTDKTSDLSGYIFVFRANGSFTATLNANATPGTWSEGSTGEGKTFTIQWGPGAIPAVLLLIEKKWYEASVSSMSVEFQDDLSTTTQELHFERN